MLTCSLRGPSNHNCPCQQLDLKLTPLALRVRREYAASVAESVATRANDPSDFMFNYAVRATESAERLPYKLQLTLSRFNFKIIFIIIK